jgi:hypothetical protein
MSFLWLQPSANPALAEYARAYERAVTSGSIDSVISWELGGYKAKDGTVITQTPEAIKNILMKDPRYASFILQISTAVKALRHSRDTALASPARNVSTETRV